MWRSYRPYVSVAERQARAARKLNQLAKQGRQAVPVQVAGRQIADTFWGRAWCDNLEAYSDFGNRLPRGRTYVRNGSVIDLQIQPGRVTALVNGSDLYEVRIGLTPLKKPVWSRLKAQCSGRIGSLVDLLQGKLSSEVMGIVTARDCGLFPKPQEIDMRCSCPDYAYLCKHLAAVLYGIGARLDRQPELLFLLRKVDHLELIAAAGERAAAPRPRTKKQTIAEESLSDIFGIELETSATGATRASVGKRPPKPPSRSRPPRRRPAASRPALAGTSGKHKAKRAVPALVAEKRATPVKPKSLKRRTVEPRTKPSQTRPANGVNTKARRRPNP